MVLGDCANIYLLLHHDLLVEYTRLVTGYNKHSYKQPYAYLYDLQCRLQTTNAMPDRLALHVQSVATDTDPRCVPVTLKAVNYTCMRICNDKLHVGPAAAATASLPTATGMSLLPEGKETRREARHGYFDVVFDILSTLLAAHAVETKFPEYL